MKIINNIDQSSNEWLKLRLGKATCSNFKKIVTSKGELSKTLREYALQLAGEKLITEIEETYKNSAMQKGTELEPEAREMYQEYSFNVVKEIAFFDCIDWGGSPDGLIGEEGLIEIKCPEQVNHTKYLYEDRIPAEYVQQCQGALMVSGRKWLDFISYNPNFKEGKKLFVKRVYRDEEFIIKLKRGIEKVIDLRDEFLAKIEGGQDEYNLSN